MAVKNLQNLHIFAKFLNLNPITKKRNLFNEYDCLILKVCNFVHLIEYPLPV